MISCRGVNDYSGRGPDAAIVTITNLLVGVLRNRHLRHISIVNGKVQAEEILLADRGGRFREVQIGADGAIYTLAESVDGKERSGQLLRLSRPGASRD